METTSFGQLNKLVNIIFVSIKSLHYTHVASREGLAIVRCFVLFHAPRRHSILLFSNLVWCQLKLRVP